MGLRYGIGTLKYFSGAFMATITKNSAGNWKALIRKKGWPTTSKTFNTKRDATDWARSVEDEMVRGVYINRAPSEKLTVKMAMLRYLNEVTPTKAAGALKREPSLAKAIIEELGDYSLAALNVDIVAKYRDKRMESKTIHGKTRSANSVRLEIVLLSHMFTVAIQEWGCGLILNPAKAIRKPKLPPGRDRRLPLEDAFKLIVECRNYSNPMLYWIVRLALATGMRKSEVGGLQRSWVDLEKRKIRLPHWITKNGEAREIPLTVEAVEVLDAAMNHIRVDDTDLIFWGSGRDSQGNRKRYLFEKGWAVARKRAGIHDFKFHDLRHEAVSRLVEGRLSDQEVVSISGHKTMQMLKRYTHLRNDYLVERLDDVESPW